MKNRIFAIATLALVAMLHVCAAASAETRGITIDSVFDDWQPADVVYTDADDAPAGAIELGRLYLADDEDFLFCRLEIGKEIILNDGNNLRLYLDTDANAATGLAINGIGAELEWRFGTRSGTFRTGASTFAVDQFDIQFRGAPTVSADEFEFALGRDAMVLGIFPIFSGATVRVMIADVGGDQLPEAAETITYTMDTGPPPATTIIPFERELPTDLRVVNWNVLFDTPWDSGQEPRFGRALAAVAPDIVNFQEIYDHSAAEAATLVGNWVSLPMGESWHAVENNDCITVSRYPVVWSQGVDGNLAVLLDTTAAIGTELLIVNAHLPCCDNNNQRQAEVDHIMDFLRDQRQPGATPGYADGTPIIITGDLNLVTLAQHLNTLLTGDIVLEGPYGPDYVPDYDGSDFANLISRHTEKRMGYTWRDDGTNFWPGHLDFVIYSDSVLSVANHFLVYTPEMSTATLMSYGLMASDSQASDHLLGCADFRAVVALEGDFDGDGDVDLGDFSTFSLCFAGANIPPAPSCPPGIDADFDDDGDVDLSDFSAFSLNFTGPL